MNVLGIIAEYNPFHLGHAYQIETLKKETHADYVIIAMSGNFVQRGAPALIDKYTRAQMALNNGADLVLELPALYATASAEYFAKGGVCLLHSTGVVTHLGFGTEHNNLPLLQEISNVLVKNPPVFQKQLQQELKNGLSFPAARAKALETAFITLGYNDLSQLHEILASPNNILAIEYLKALSTLNSTIIPSPLLRKGHGYHDTSLSEVFCSASAIRSYLRENKNILHHASFQTPAMPESALNILMNYPYSFLFEDDFSQLVHYKLLTESVDTLAAYADSSLELANRIHHARHSFTSWSQFCELLKAKNTTYTRISRLLLHLILGIKNTDYDIFHNSNPISYLRVLGFKKSAAPLLSNIKDYGSAPLITGIANVQKDLSPEAFSCLQKDITASDIYNLATQTASLNKKGCQPPLNDYRHPIIILS